MLDIFGRVFDKDGGLTNLIASVEVVGVAPVATLSNTGPTVEGNPVTISVSEAAGPINVGYGLRAFDIQLSPRSPIRASLAVSYRIAGTSPTVTFLPQDNGTYTVFARILDKNDLYTDMTTVVVVSDVPPSATMASTGPIEEGGSVLVGLLGPNDPSPIDTVLGFHYKLRHRSLATCDDV